MEYREAKQQFIQAWGTLGSSWGINKAMAQIHALLLVAPGPISAEEIMTELQMSRGNVNMNLRALIDWGIVKREHKAGERREYFSTSKDVWELASQVSRERRKREIEPILTVLRKVQNVSGDNKRNVAEFKKVARDLHEFTTKVDGLIDKASKSDHGWFMKLLMKL